MYMYAFVGDNTFFVLIATYANVCRFKGNTHVFQWFNVPLHTYSILMNTDEGESRNVCRYGIFLDICV